jgi:hypothetical protein
MSSAKQMKPLGYKAAQLKGAGYQAEVMTGPAGRDARPKKGQPPKAQMYQGLFGGKKPA